MSIQNRRSLKGNLCSACRYHSYKRLASGGEQHACHYTFPNVVRLPGAIAECTEFFPAVHQHISTLEPIAWVADLTKGRAGFIKPGGD